ncbi:unnamed protein product [Moneuplotes crassus]|uniref:Uncharacterized protein n=1 Tax=Euplotes crassus TaxID=5936 RepID=A0AAD1X436_EUPCR|nr:unnamed protein product [Moneuplotes crassus]
MGNNFSSQICCKGCKEACGDMSEENFNNNEGNIKTDIVLVGDESNKKLKKLDCNAGSPQFFTPPDYSSNPSSKIIMKRSDRKFVTNEDEEDISIPPSIKKGPKRLQWEIQNCIKLASTSGRLQSTSTLASPMEFREDSAVKVNFSSNQHLETFGVKEHTTDRLKDELQTVVNFCAFQRNFLSNFHDQIAQKNNNTITDQNVEDRHQKTEESLDKVIEKVNGICQEDTQHDPILNSEIVTNLHENTSKGKVISEESKENGREPIAEEQMKKPLNHQITFNPEQMINAQERIDTNNEPDLSEIAPPEGTPEVDWEEFDQLDYTTKKEYGEGIQGSEDDDFDLQENHEVLKELNQRDTFFTIPSRASNQVERYSHKRIERKLKTVDLSNTEYVSPKNASLTNQHLNICNFKCVDVEDHDKVMQEYYGHKEELELHTIQEVSMEFSRASDINSCRSSGSPRQNQSKPEETGLFIRDTLKFFKKNSEEFIELTCEFTGESLECYEESDLESKLFMKINTDSMFKIIPRYDKYMDLARYKFEIILTEEYETKEGLHHSAMKKSDNFPQEDIISENKFYYIFGCDEQSTYEKWLGFIGNCLQISSEN